MPLSSQIIDSVMAARDRRDYNITIDSPSPNILKAVLGYIPEDECEYVGQDYITLTNGSTIRVQ